MLIKEYKIKVSGLAIFYCISSIVYRRDIITALLKKENMGLQQINLIIGPQNIIPLQIPKSLKFNLIYKLSAKLETKQKQKENSQ